MNPSSSHRPGANRPDQASGRQRADAFPQTGSRRTLTSHERMLRERRRQAQRQKEQRIVLCLLTGIFVMTLVLMCVILVGKRGEDNPPAPPLTSDEISTDTSGSAGPSADTGKSTDAATNTGKPADTDAGKTTDAVTEKPTNVFLSVSDVTFKADLSAYEAYMNPQGDQKDAYLTLVNPQNPMSAADIPDDLVDIDATRKDGRATQQMRLYAAKALEAMFAEADALGYINYSTGYLLSVTSAYRAYSYQNYLFNLYVTQEREKDSSLTLEEAEAIVEKYSCRAGTSEHQSGLCADLHNQLYADEVHPETFANTPEGSWLHENCWKFGFVLRFPSDKTEQTGISYESWHFRYVGRYHAYQMKVNNMCLEEYVAYLNSLS